MAEYFLAKCRNDFSPNAGMIFRQMPEKSDIGKLISDVATKNI